MPIGFIIRSDEAVLVQRIFAADQLPGTPTVQNNLFEFSPRYGLRILTRLQNADLNDDERRSVTRLVNRLADYLGANHAAILFDRPAPPDTTQYDLFESVADTEATVVE